MGEHNWVTLKPASVILKCEIGSYFLTRKSLSVPKVLVTPKGRKQYLNYDFKMHSSRILVASAVVRENEILGIVL